MIFDKEKSKKKIWQSNGQSVLEMEEQQTSLIRMVMEVHSGNNTTQYNTIQKTLSSTFETFETRVGQ